MAVQREHLETEAQPIGSRPSPKDCC